MVAQEPALFDDPARGAVIDETGTYRYRLWRTWDESLPSLGWVMLNPSTGDANRDDNTLRKCIAFAHEWGHGGIVVANLFAYRTAYPKVLKTARTDGVDIVGPDNDGHLRFMPPRTVFAFGAGAGLQTSRQRWLAERVAEVEPLIREPRRLVPPPGFYGNVAGPYAPHPLYLPPDTTRLADYQS